MVVVKRKQRKPRKLKVKTLRKPKKKEKERNIKLYEDKIIFVIYIFQI